MQHIPPHVASRLTAIEHYTGWLSLTFAVTMAIGNPHAVIYRVAEHSSTRGVWTAIFLLIGICQLLSNYMHSRRARFVLAVFVGIHWGIFGAQTMAIGAHGAALLSLVAVGHMLYVAAYLHRSGWD